MVTVKDIFVGDIGTRFRAIVKDRDDVPVDISDAFVKNIEFTDPSGTVVSVAGSFTTNGEDGKLEYIVVTGDFLDTAGTWLYRAFVQYPGGERHTSQAEFVVWAL